MVAKYFQYQLLLCSPVMVVLYNFKWLTHIYTFPSHYSISLEARLRKMEKMSNEYGAFSKFPTSPFLKVFFSYIQATFYWSFSFLLTHSLFLYIFILKFDTHLFSLCDQTITMYFLHTSCSLWIQDSWVQYPFSCDTSSCFDYTRFLNSPSHLFIFLLFPIFIEQGR